MKKLSLPLIFSGFIAASVMSATTLAHDPKAHNEHNHSHHHDVKLVAGLDKQQIRFADIEPFIEQIKQNDLFRTEQVGSSYQGRPIYRISVGEGDTVVFMWSQMHGDESTATPALFDLMEKIEKDEQWRESWADDITLHMIPMVNPDGAELAQRYNVQGIDVNRDAMALQTPEGQVLMAQSKALQPDFGFNLHDQSRYYEVGNTGKTATISVLAPAYNHAKDINDSRGRAMKLIGDLGAVTEAMIPGHVGRYNDTFAPRAFGDNFSAMGISTILIESGAYPQDPNRQKARAVNVAMLIRALDSIANEAYADVTLEPYHKIPMNNSNSFKDVIFDDVQVVDGEHTYRIDIGINRSADARRNGSIREVGDLSVFPAFERHDAQNLTYKAGKAYSVPAKGLTLSHHEYLQLLKEGFTHFDGDADKLNISTHLPVLVNPRSLPGSRPQQRQNATFLLQQQDEVVVAVLAGVVIQFN
ncbi:M14 family metallopeptidase [Pseudidiomarina terrestris]|uniref:M14 family metallopeptidase n=1 Tax=Pseudidiomarina terrestris TaxID=2820060 RepID=UPI002652C79D|nr:M14 metallopeptidase family protein [Pseudidiomarina sp. 1ASP75-5]MDN7135380.1 peptidase M14 [Pseudidiomarina sp. 1ASP75-5]